MVVDILDPGDRGEYPHWPRDAQGHPITTEQQARDAGSGTYVPTGTELSADRDRDGYRKVHDLAPRKPDGTPIAPPTLPPAG